MLWPEEKRGDLPGDGEGSSCSSPLQERTKEESKSIHFPLTSCDCLGRGGEGWGGSRVWAWRRGEWQNGCPCAEPITTGKSWNHNPAPRAHCLLQRRDDKEEPQRSPFMSCLLTWGQRRGGTELAALPAALSSCPSCGKRGADSLLRKRTQRESAVCLTRLGRGLGRAWLCPLFWPCRALGGVFLTGKMWWEQFNGASGYAVSPVDTVWDCMTELRFILPSCRSCTEGPSEEPISIGSSLVHRGGETKRGTSAFRSVELSSRDSQLFFDMMRLQAWEPLLSIQNEMRWICAFLIAEREKGKHKQMKHKKQPCKVPGWREGRENEKAGCSFNTFNIKVCFILRQTKHLHMKSLIQNLLKSMEIFLVTLAGSERDILGNIQRGIKITESF